MELGTFVLERLFGNRVVRDVIDIVESISVF